MDELTKMTGQANLQSTPRLILNELLINGESGVYRKRVWVNKGDGKPEDLDLGDKVATVWLKIRRKLVERGNNGQIVRSTNEHNTVNDFVTVYEEGKEVFKGNAKDARVKYEGLRTVQVVYALLLAGTEPELVRISIKGASLGSDSKPKDVMNFYDYVATFDTEPIINYITEVGVVQEVGRKTYYAMTFTRGKAVEKNMPLVLEKLKEVHEYTLKYDKGEVPSVTAREEEIDEKQIPF